MNERLNTQDLVDLLAERHGMSKRNSDEFVKEFFLLIEEALVLDQCVKIKGLGTFKLVDIDSRESVNVNTGERIQIEGHRKVSFTPDVTLRDVVNKPFAHFETVVLNDNTVLENTPEEEEQDDDANEVVVATSQEPSVHTMPEESLKDLPLSAEEIIANELRRADLDFTTVRVEPPKVKTQIEPSLEKPVALNPKKEEKPATAYLIAIIVAVLLLCGGVIAFVYYPGLFSVGVGKELVQEVKAEAKLMVQPTVLPDTVAVIDTVAQVVSEAKSVLTEKVVKETPRSNVAEVASTKLNPEGNYKIVGTKTTYTVKEGDTLIKISLRFYGSKNLWFYIVQHNKNIVMDPDHVPRGTVLNIPELVEK